MNYHPDLLAKGLAPNRSYSIGLVMSNAQNQIFTEFITLATLYARQHGHDIIIGAGNDSASCFPRQHLYQ